MGGWCTERKRSSPNFARAGFTLVELLLALALGAIILGVSLRLVLSERTLYRLDRERTEANQGARATLDLLGADIRQAGERLPIDLDPVVVRPGELITRRNLLDAVLPLCDNINAGSSQDVVFVARRNPPQGTPPQCYPTDGDGDGWDDRLEVFSDYRQRMGGVVTLYIYNPATRQGEFFAYDREDQSQFHIHRAQGQWNHTYLQDQQPRIYALEERRYVLQGNRLVVYLNGDTQNPQALVAGVTGFTVQALTPTGPQTQFGNGVGHPQDLQGVRVEIRIREGGLERTLSAQYFPRNILSW